MYFTGSLNKLETLCFFRTLNLLSNLCAIKCEITKGKISPNEIIITKIYLIYRFGVHWIPKGSFFLWIIRSLEKKEK